MGSSQDDDVAKEATEPDAEEQTTVFAPVTQEIPEQVEGEEERISLQRVLLDAYEFHGMADLGKSVILFIVGLMFLYYQWGNTAAQFKNSMINNLATWDYGTDWQQYNLQNVDSISKGAFYSLGLLHSLMAKTQALQIPDAQISPADFLQAKVLANDTAQFHLKGNRTVWVTEFSQINYARITVDLDRNCDMKSGHIAYSQHHSHRQRKLECYKDRCTQVRSATNSSKVTWDCSDPDLTLFFQRWRKIDWKSKHKGTYVLTLFTTEDGYEVFDYVSQSWQPVTSVDQSMGLLADMVYGSVPTGEQSPVGPTCTDGDADVAYPPPCFFGPEADVNNTYANNGGLGPVDRRVLGKYGAELKLGLVASDRLSRQKDAAMFTLTITLSGDVSPRLMRLSGTSTLKTDSKTAAIVILDFLYVFFMLFFIRLEVARWRLCDKQSKSTALYFMYWWNWLQIFSWLSNLGFLIWGWAIPEITTTIPVTADQYDALEYHADAYTVWLMFGAFMVFLLGVSVCRFMRIHLGLKAFYGVFIDAGRMMLDFAVFVLYIMLLLGAIVFAFFQISGGNTIFSDFTDGISAMARLMFLYLSYDQFANYGLGLGQWYWTVTILFFLAAVLLVVFTFNVLLAIFITAYQNQRAKSLKVDFIFMYLVYLRILFFCFELYKHYLAVPVCTVLGWKLPCEVEMPTPQSFRAFSSLSELSPRSQDEPTVEGKPNFFSRIIHLLKAYHVNSLGLHRTIFAQFEHKQEILEHRRRLLWARWCVARLPETRALVGMYTNYATLKLQRVRWLEIDEAMHSNYRETREHRETIEMAGPLGITVPEDQPLPATLPVTTPGARWRRTASLLTPDATPRSPGSNDQVALFTGPQPIPETPRSEAASVDMSSSMGVPAQGTVPTGPTPQAAALPRGPEHQASGSQEGQVPKWRKDSLKGIGSAIGTMVQHLRRSRSKRAKGSEVLPPVTAELSREELRALLMFIALNAKRLSFRHAWVRWLLGSTPMDHLQEAYVDQVVETIFETYSHVPKPVREEEADEEGVKPEEKPAFLLRKMGESWKGERDEVEVQLDRMKRMVTDAIHAAQQASHARHHDGHGSHGQHGSHGHGQLGREIQRRQHGGRLTPRYWSQGS